jgi:hypothetical protein
MKVVHLCDHATIRVIKQAWIDPASIILCRTMSHGDLMPVLPCRLVVWSRESLGSRLLELLQPGDILQVHTTIGSVWLPAMVRRVPAQLRVRMVWDCHDWCPQGEAVARSVMSDGGIAGAIVPSRGMARQVAEAFPGFPTQVVYSMVPAGLLRAIKFDRNDVTSRLQAAILVGGVTRPGGEPRYFDYSAAEAELRRIKLPLFYLPSAGSDPSGRSLVLESQPYSRMFDVIREFGYGYAGAAGPDSTLHDCATNKFWEYAACGIKIVVWHSREMSGLISLNHDADGMGIGWYLADWSMESQAGAIQAFYRAIGGGAA